MERMLAKNLDVLENFLDEPSDNLSVRGFLMSVFRFCDDALTQIMATNNSLKFSLDGFEILREFLQKNGTKDLSEIEFSEFLNTAKAITLQKEPLNELFKRTKRTNDTKYEVF